MKHPCNIYIQGTQDEELKIKIRKLDLNEFEKPSPQSSVVPSVVQRADSLK